MKILMLNYEFPPLGGGASPASYEIAKRYVRLGHQVDVVTMGFKNLPSFEVVEGINIYRVMCWRTRKEICYPWEQLTYIISALLFLKKHLRTHRYDVNHTHFIIPTGYIALRIKNKYGLRYVITSHGSDVLGYNVRFKKIYPWIKKTWTRIVENADVVTTPSSFLQKKIFEHTHAGNFIVIPYTIDTQLFTPLKKEKRIIIVARLFVNKGIQDIFEALKGMDLNGWNIDIVGDGPYRIHLENLADRYGLKSKITFHGWIDNKSNQMKDLYGRAAIFISASYFESMGLVLLEAIASGCYPLATAVGGHLDILTEEFLFNVADPGQLKQKLLPLLNSDAPLKPFKLDKKFEWDHIILQYEKALNFKTNVFSK